ncbi:MAG: TIGR02266 family protein [Myxococcota bacterium]
MTLRVTLRHATLDEFIERHAEHVSSGGLFVRTRSPKATGTKVHFELKLADGQVALKGTGVVVSVRQDDRPGMSLRFSELDDEARGVVDRMVETHGEGALAPTPLALKLPGSSTDILRRGWATGDISPSWPVADYSGVSATGPLRSPSDIGAAKEQTKPNRGDATPVKVPSASTMPPFESASADLARPAEAGPPEAEPAEPSEGAQTGPFTEDLASDSQPSPEPSGAEDPSIDHEASSEEAKAKAEPEEESEDVELEFEDAVGFDELPDSEAASADPAWNEATRVDEKASLDSTGDVDERASLDSTGDVDEEASLDTTGDVDTDETSFAGLLESSPSTAPLAQTEDLPTGPLTDAPQSEAPTGDVWPGGRGEDEQTLSGEQDDFEAVTEMGPAASPADEGEVDVDVDLGSEFPLARDDESIQDTGAGLPTDPQIRLDSGLQGPAPHDRSMDLVEDEIRAVGIDLDARRVRIGTLERREFRWLTPAVGLPALVGLLDDGTLIAGTRAERRAEEDSAATVAPVEILLGVRDGALSDPGLPALDWGPRGGSIQLGEATFPAYELLVSLAKCIQQTIQESLTDSNDYRAFVSLPPEIDDGCVSLLRTAFREAGLPVAEFDVGPRSLLTAFGLDEQPDRHILVVSIGETRSQLSVVRGLRAVAEVVVDDVSARAIDDHIVGLIVTALLQHSNEDHRGDAGSQLRLREAVALARNDLKRTPQVDVETALPGPEGRLIPRAFKLDRTQIYQATEQTTGRLHEHLVQLLREAGVDPRSLGAVVLAGEGATFPPFEQVLSRLCDREPSTTAPPAMARVLGLAKMGRAVEQEIVARRPDTLDESVGVGLPGGRFKVLVPAGSKLPVRVLRVQPLRASQSEFVLDLLQGNGERISSCKALGEVALRGLPKSPSGLKIEMELTVGETGVLDVRLREPKSGMQETARFATSQATEDIPKPTPSAEAESGEGSKGFLGRLFGRS